jgi:chromatin remodeling complex protein RSC6
MPPRSAQRWDAPEAAATSPATLTTSATPGSEDSALARLVQELESNYRANEASLAPDLKATYEKSLVSLNDSIRECLDSLQHEPRNTLAHEYLLTAYTRKAEILSSALEFEGR